MSTPTETVYLWRLPEWASHRFDALASEMEYLEPYSEDYLVMADEIRGLPGFPRDSEQYDLIRREITSVTVGVH